MADVLIIGGGVIGLLLAKDLVERSVSVELIDRSALGTEASWAGGGIVSPLYPWNYSAAITALASWAQHAYPDLALELKEATGIDPEFNPSGLLMLDPPAFNDIVAWASQHRKQCDVLNSAQVAEQEPFLERDCQKAVWWPQIGNIRNPRLLQSLAAYLSQHPLCKVEEKVEARAVQKLDDGRAQVVTSEGNLEADKVVVCAGAWAGDLLAGAGISMNIQPVKGQMLVFEPQPGLINSIVLHEGRYLIPRVDGRIIVGSTLEHTGYDKTITDDARQTLLQQAYSLVPALRSVPVEAHWAGLRPGSPHGIPYIGAIPGWSNLYVNAGHFRNGLVLAPASVRLMTNILLGQDPIVDPLPYAPDTTRPTAEMF